MTSLSNASDNDLVILLRGGSKEAYTEIYNRYKWLLHVHTYKKLGNRDEVNDLLQDVFANLWTNRETLFITSTLSAYLYTIVRNKALNILEHRHVESKYIDSLAEYAKSYVAVTDHLVREKQLTMIIAKEIAALPPKMRQVFELSRKSNLSHKEIAALLDISEETVKKQIKNAIKALRLRLGAVFYMYILTQL